MNRSIFALFLSFIVISTATTAGEWTIGSTVASPGANVTVPVQFAGDGVTQVAELEIAFDDGRLSLPVESGILPGAAVGGSLCSRTSSNRISVVTNPTSNSPLPTSPKTVCNLPFQVRNPAAPGNAPVAVVQAQCFGGTTSVTPCTVVNGKITVTGTVTSPPVTSANRKYLSVVLSAAPGAPTVSQIVGINFAAPAPRPVSGLDTGNPIRAFPLLPVRATGDFLAYLETYPNTARAKLERTVLIEYPQSSDVVSAQAAIQEDPFVLAAALMSPPQYATPPSSVGVEKSRSSTKSTANQYHLDALKVPTLRGLAGGWSLLGFIDSGISIDHPDLRSFSGPNSQSGSYVGGGYLPGFAIDFGRYPDFIDDNIDEAELVPNAPVGVNACDGDSDGLMEPLAAGHGTNVAGIATANSTNFDNIDGVCGNCSFAMMKITRHECLQVSATNFEVFTIFPEPPLVPAFESLARNGAQVISMSFGLPVQPVNFFCTFNGNQNANHPYCLMLQFASDNDVAVSASSGNFRSDVFFPGNDRRVDSAGGLNESLNFWDESPGGDSQCPYWATFMNTSECGSNFSQGTAGVPRQDFVAPARTVRASIYPGKDWNSVVGCGDSFGGGSSSDGIGVCTGTSMSAPQIAAVLGILRSINPLLRTGDPESSVVNGLRNVVAATTDRALALQGWDPEFGYGTPNAAEAAKKILGTVRGRATKNRVTPLFGLYSAGAKDYATVASPQAATALVRYSPAVYSSTGSFIQGQAISGYSSFPFESGTPAPAARARAYVLTTEFSRQPSDPPLTPLFLFDRSRNWPAGCNPSVPPCNINNRDFAMTTSTTDLSAAVAASYRYLGLQGYVYSRCVNEPACIPVGAEKLYQQCNASDDDCAVFLERDLSAFQSAGYTSLPGFSSDAVLGYAYPTIDSDNDGLVDGMEYVIGTNPAVADSDGDGQGDALEFPQAGVSLSDPCAGPTITCLIGIDEIFRDGFE